jgi:hypothetical protein
LSFVEATAAEGSSFVDSVNYHSVGWKSIAFGRLDHLGDLGFLASLSLDSEDYWDARNNAMADLPFVDCN